VIPRDERWKAIAIAALVVASIVVLIVSWPMKLGLDLQGGTSIVLQAVDNGQGLPANTMDRLIGVMERRVNQLGISESIVQQRGSNRIAIELPAYDDQETAVAALGRTARLTMSDENGVVIVEGADLKDAYLDTDAFRRNAVAIKMNPEGAQKFAEFTRANVGRYIIIRLDDDIISNAQIQEPILDGNGQISGNFTVKEATELAALLKAGALPVPVEVVEAHTVGPSLGEASIRESLRAAIIGLIGTVAFMILMYRGLGLVAAAALVIFAILVTGAMAGVGAVLTLPGIAGLVLTIGMAVDGNVLIFERAKEEYKLSGSVVPSLRKGFSRAFTAIFDSNATTFLAAVILFIYTVGSVKGYALTLGLGVIASFLTAVTASRIMAYILAGTKLGSNPKWMGLVSSVKPRSWNIVGKQSIWFAITGLLLVGSLVAIFSQGLNWGLDFAGGNLVEIKTARTLSLAEIEQYVAAADISASSIQPADGFFVLKGTSIAKESVDTLVTNLEEAGITTSVQRQEFVGPTIGSEVRSKAATALLIALLFQMIYVSFRFEWRYALAAVISLFTTVVVLIGLFAALGLEVDSNFLAALLTIIGYAINDTIVIFDRIRENRKHMVNVSYADMVNSSLNESIARSLNTGASVLLVLFVLLVAGGSTLYSFALALFVGVLFGTYSSVFNAAQIAVLLHNNKGTANSRKLAR
jgi:SecD/SecF fusion protein